VSFEQIKFIARFIGENLTDDDLMDLMHAIFISNNTGSNEEITFD
jgi:hypothetical protein